MISLTERDHQERDCVHMLDVCIRALFVMRRGGQA